MSSIPGFGCKITFPSPNARPFNSRHELTLIPSIDPPSLCLLIIVPFLSCLIATENQWKGTRYAKSESVMHERM